jgi:hypothetical protein
VVIGGGAPAANVTVVPAGSAKDVTSAVQGIVTAAASKVTR